MTNNQYARGLVQTEADPPLLYLAVLIVKLGQQIGIQKYSGCLLERHTVVSRVSLCFRGVPFELILELVWHGVIVSRALRRGQRHNGLPITRAERAPASEGTAQRRRVHRLVTRLAVVEGRFEKRSVLFVRSPARLKNSMISACDFPPNWLA